MPAYIARITRNLANCSRNQNEFYAHAVNGFQRLGAVDSLAEWLAAHPESPWLDEQYHEYVVELDSEAEFNALSTNGPWWDDKQNLPRWQQKAGNTSSTKELGSYADPTDDQSVWSLGVMVPDDRFILRVYNDDPVAEPSAVHIGDEEFDETAATEITRYMRLFDQSDTPINNNSGNQRTDVGGKLMDFDFGSSHSPAISAGVTSFKVDISRTGTIWFFSNHKYRFIGPVEDEPRYYKAEIYGKVLRASLE